jgi:hypothetical protein
MDRMTTRVGVGIGRDRLRAVALLGERIVWAGERPFASDDDLGAVLSAFLAEVPVRRFLPTALSAAVGPHFAPVKTLHGLPATEDPAVLSALVRENLATFFLKNGIPLVSTNALPIAPGVAIAGTVEEPVLEAVRQACATRRWRLRAVMPVAPALARVVEDDNIVWREGDLTTEITADAGGLKWVRTRPSPPDEPLPVLRPTPALAALGAEASRFADAFGAAELGEGASVRVHSMALAPAGSHRQWHRFRAPGLLLVVSVLGLFLAPLGSKLAEQRALRRVTAVSPEHYHTIDRSLEQLAWTTSMLASTAHFTGTHPPLAPLLGTLAVVLPPDCFLLALELRETSGELTAACTDAAALLRTMRRVPEAADAELAGPVRRELIAGIERQRTAVRWKRGTE